MGAGTIIDRTNKGVGITPESADHGTKSEFLKNPKQGALLSLIHISEPTRPY